MKRETRAPLIVAIVLLLLPVLYVGSYLALSEFACIPNENGGVERFACYRIGGERAALIFLPLEQIDRILRPKEWERVIPDVTP